MTHTMTPTKTTKEINTELALKVVQTEAVFRADAEAFRNIRDNAPKTPTGRISKQGKADIAAADAKRDAAYKAFEDAKQELHKYLYNNALFWAPKTRGETLQKIENLFGNKVVTDVWADHIDAYHAARKVTDGVNNYRKGNVVVLDVTNDNPAFKNVRSHVGYGSDAHDEFSDYHAHLWLWIGDTGHITRARLFTGAKAELDTLRPSSYPLDDQFGIDLDKGVNGLCISTCNGTTSEVRAWAAKLTLACDILEKLQPLYKETVEADFDRRDMALKAKEMLANNA